MKLWQIPTTSIKHYIDNTEDGNWIRVLRGKFVSGEYKLTNVREGIKFPGLHGDNNDYKEFYNSNFRCSFCPPRGNINKHGVVVMGINPGAAEESEIIREPMWLFGNSSAKLQNDLEKMNIYPYFTDIIKDPFKDKEGKPINKKPYKDVLEMEEYLEPHLKIVYQELTALSPELVILLGKTAMEFDEVRELLDGLKINHHTLSHPNARGLTREGRFKEWRTEIQGIPNIQLQPSSDVSYRCCKSAVSLEWIEFSLSSEFEFGDIEIRYAHNQNDQGFLVACLPNFYNLERGNSDKMRANILRCNSLKFTEDNLKGNEIVTEAKNALKPYILARVNPGHDKQIAKNLWTHLNG